jgi:hypothetical protein
MVHVLHGRLTSLPHTTDILGSMVQEVCREDAVCGRDQVLPVRRRVQGQGGGAAPSDGAAAMVTVVGARAHGGAGPLLDMRQGRRGRCSLRLRGATEGHKAKGSRSSAMPERAKKRRRVLPLRSLLKNKVFLCFMGACAFAWWTAAHKHMGSELVQ